MPHIEVKVEQRLGRGVAKLVPLLDQRTMQEVLLIPGEAFELSRALVETFAAPETPELGEFAFCMRELSDAIYLGRPLAELTCIIAIVGEQAQKFSGGRS
jgi:hypothetical protein